MRTRLPDRGHTMRSVAAAVSTAVVAVAVLVGAWLLFAPTQLGGGTRYAVVHGTSMEPGLSGGDLVLVRNGRTPRVGDVVLYRDSALRVRVLHRVIRIEGDRLVLKGDANDFVDDPRPRTSEVVGTYWFSVPRAGSTLAWIHVPLHAAAFAFVLTLVAFSGGVVVRPGTNGEPTEG
jgi:signal peptidase I